MSKGGLNPYLMEMANIREHCSWSHADNPEQATKKAESLTKMAISKVSHSQPLEKGCIKTEKRVLIIGGGIAGIQSSLDLADSGYEVTLVEKSPSIGGVMAQLSRTFPTDDCSTCILSPKMAEVNENPNINLMTYSEITDISGSLGNFKIKIKKKTRYIDEEKCVSCGVCTEKCPVTIEDNFNCNMSNTKAIRLPFSYAAPLQYYIEKDSCLRLTKGGEVCGICQTVCPKDAIDFNLKDEIIELTVDSVIVATGFDIFDATKKPEYNFGRSSNIIDGLQVERFIVNKVEGTLLREMGNKIAFIQCIGSRDEQIGREYCSRVCCMYAIKQAKILKTMNPAADVYIFYIDIRAFGKGYEEYYTQAQNVGVKFVRGKVAALREDEETGKVIVRAEDTLNREIIEGEFDTVVLSVGMGPNKGTESVAEMLKLSKTPDGFLQEAHPKFKPVDTMVPG
ncbi:CoB--CoM heterodisulfide reductase iron-sulfur subunit A family protein, partial [bacterium]|nr:CoB--CoM heterodisulfide reductase iron-sulfur subunit A family protein [bacterium]